MPTDASLLAELGRLAEEAGRLAQRERERLSRELKPDGSIVTNADRAVEEWLRGELPRVLPGSTVWGEEFGREEEGPAGRWVVDPVDGTSNFAFGSPLWGVSIALLSGADVRLGAVVLPDLGETYLASAGTGTTRNGDRLPDVPPGPIADHELVSCGDWARRKLGERRVPGKARLSGAFVIDGCFTVCQRYRGMIACGERVYDVAACALFGREVGMEVRRLDGTPMDFAPFLEGAKFDEPWLIFPRESGF